MSILKADSRMDNDKKEFDLQEYLTRGVERVVSEALRSPLFTALRDGGVLMDDHEGGCVLYEKRELVEALLTRSRQ